MSYRLPNFNLSTQIWQGGHTPAVDPPDLIAVSAQLYVHSKGSFGDYVFPSFQYVPAIFLRFPLGAYLPNAGDIVDSLTPPGDYYLVGFAQRIHVGFPNEYWMVSVLQCTSSGAVPRP